jgi:arsenate reductase
MKKHPEITIYHNPRCSKSREALKLLRDHGVEPKVVEYLVDPPDSKQLDIILKLLDIEPRALMRKKEPEYAAAGLDDPALGRKALIQAMCAHPRLIERPIVLAQDRAVLGRPPEKVLNIIP